MSDVVNLGLERAQRAQDNRQWTPIECLQDCLDSLRAGEVRADRIFIIRVAVGEDGDGFDVGYNAANINASTALAALEVCKVLLLKDMNYIPKRSDE